MGESNSKINEKVCFYCLVICFFILIFSILGNCFQQYKLGKYRSECEQYRLELQEATERYADITNTIRRANEEISFGSNSIQELREQIFEVRKFIEELENCINSSNNTGYKSNITSDTN